MAIRRDIDLPYYYSWSYLWPEWWKPIKKTNLSTRYSPGLAPPSAWRWLLGGGGAWLCWPWLNHWCHELAAAAVEVEREALKWVGLYWGGGGTKARWPLWSHFPDSGRSLPLDAHLCEQTGAAAGCSYFWIACCRWHRYEQHGLDELVAFLEEVKERTCFRVQSHLQHFVHLKLILGVF